eukprot:31535-Pelagococcus_subviridis.AAC.9
MIGALDGFREEGPPPLAKRDGNGSGSGSGAAWTHRVLGTRYVAARSAASRPRRASSTLARAPSWVLAPRRTYSSARGSTTSRSTHPGVSATASASSASDAARSRAAASLASSSRSNPDPDRSFSARRRCFASSSLASSPALATAPHGNHASTATNGPSALTRRAVARMSPAPTPSRARVRHGVDDDSTHAAASAVPWYFERASNPARSFARDAESGRRPSCSGAYSSHSAPSVADASASLRSAARKSPLASSGLALDVVNSSLDARSECAHVGVALPYSSLSSSSAAAANPPNPPRSSRRTLKPRNASHSSAKKRIRSRTSSLLSSVSIHAAPSPKPANASTPCHNPVRRHALRGWNIALPKSVQLLTSPGVSRRAADASKRAAASSRRFFFASSFALFASASSEESEGFGFGFGFFPGDARMWLVIFARRASIASAPPPPPPPPPPPHFFRFRPSSSSSSSISSISSSVSILSSASAPSSPSSSSSLQRSWSSSSSRRNDDLRSGSRRTTFAAPPSHVSTGGGRSPSPTTPAPSPYRCPARFTPPMAPHRSKNTSLGTYVGAPCDEGGREGGRESEVELRDAAREETRRDATRRDDRGGHRSRARTECVSPTRYVTPESRSAYALASASSLSAKPWVSSWDDGGRGGGGRVRSAPRRGAALPSERATRSIGRSLRDAGDAATDARRRASPESSRSARPSSSRAIRTGA